MNKKIWVAIAIIILVIVAAIIFFEKKSIAPANTPTQTSLYEIDGKMVEAKYFGNEALGDLNGDGLQDKTFLITYDGGGSGTFFYAVVALKTSGGYKNTNAFFIGDRIAPQNNNINESARELYVNYAERRPEEPMTTQPSQGATKILVVTPDGKLNELIQ